MRLLVTTPMAVVVDAANVQSLRAEDETGSFGILPGHADLLTVLSVSVVTWRDDQEGEHHIAVNGGILTVKNGDQVEIATRNAIGEDSLRRLGSAVLEKFNREAAAEEGSRDMSRKLDLATVRLVQNYIEAGRASPSSVLRPPDEGLGRDTELNGVSE